MENLNPAAECDAELLVRLEPIFEIIRSVPEDRREIVSDAVVATAKVISDAFVAIEQIEQDAKARIRALAGA